MADGVAVHAVGGHRGRAVAKVCDLDEAVAVQEHVAGLDVAVDGVLLLVEIPARVYCITKVANAGCSKRTARAPEQFKVLQYYRATRGKATYHRPFSICFAML